MWLLLSTACRVPPAPLAPADALYFVLVDRFADGDADPTHAVDRADPQGWHGGDLSGVTAHLDHLQGLGIGAVWLSPVFGSQQDPVGGWGAYHGYWIDDPNRIEPRFGDLADLRGLSDALHDRGMGLYLDMVYNHVGYTSPLRQTHPDWFHTNGDVVDWGDPVQRVTHDVHGLPDLAQEHPAVYTALRDHTQTWIDAVSPDGLRIDAVRHLPEGFLRRLRGDLRGDVVFLGEIFEGNPAALADRAAADDLDAVFDFPLMYAIHDAVCRDGHLGRIGAALSWPDYGGARPVGLLDNHDTARIASVCGGDPDRILRAMAVLIASRGTPSLIWGTEVGLAGAEEPGNRADLPWDRVDGHPLGEGLAALLQLRRRWPALIGGDLRITHLTRDTLGFLRRQDDEAVWVTLGGAPAAPPGVRIVQTEVHAGVTFRRVTGWPPQRPLTSVRVPIPDRPPVPEGHRLRLVGAWPTVGGWDPQAGIDLDEDGSVLLADATLGVLEFRLGHVAPDGTFAWEDRSDNRFVRIRDQDAIAP